jgi:hypothetical protein
MTIRSLFVRRARACLRFAVVNAALLLAANSVAFGQDSAVLSGTVTDPSEAIVPGATVTVTNTERGTVRSTPTRGDGAFIFDSLPPGDYRLEIVKPGFSKLTIEHIQLKVRDRQTRRFALQLSAAAPTAVRVTAAAEGVSTDASISTEVDRKFSENLPLNGRNVNSLIKMSPGITSSAGGKGSGTDFNANGLRSNMNYFTIDGVSLNQGLGGGGMPMMGGGGGRGGGMMGGGGGMPMGGGSMDAVSMESLQQVRVQTAAFAPEFGRSPGAQISMTSRGGTNQYHGSLSEYFRNNRFNSNDWFANQGAIARGEMRQNRFAGALGGSIIHDRTFFFLSYEGLRLRAPDTAVLSVPDASSRASASSALRPFLKAFPVANGPELANGAAQYSAVVVNRSTSNFASARVDHRINDRWNAFVRYSLAPSQNYSRGTQMITPNTVSNGDSRSHSFTAAVDTVLDIHTTNDLRVNYSRSKLFSTTTMDNFGGAVPLTNSLVFPSSITTANGDFGLNVLGFTGYTYSGHMNELQTQINVVESLTRVVAKHSYKFGVDVRRTLPTINREPFTANATFNGLSGDVGALMSGSAIAAVVSGNLPSVYPKYTNISLYGQDSYRASERTTITYGLRWEINPAPGVRSGPKPFATCEVSECGVTQNTGLYQLRLKDIAPRLGIAYQLDTTPGHEVIFRGGMGTFYDTGTGMTTNIFSGAPYANVRTLTAAGFPLSDADLKVPTLPPTRPYGQISTTDSELKAPLVIQWNMALERWLGQGQMISVGYVGSEGRRLLQAQMTPTYSDAYDILMQSVNGATSKYQGMQVQYRRRLSQRLQTQLGYTWGHSMDTASHDSAPAGFATISGQDKGSSDFDVRQTLNFSGSFQLAAPKQTILKALFGNWYVDWMLTARTGLPFDIQNITTVTSSNSSSSSGKRGLYSMVRPSYRWRYGIWLPDSNVPGKRRINPAAFYLNTDYVQGNLGRNALRGFGANQADFALRRQLSLTERFRLQITAQAYNAFNHPNFANPSPMEGANMSSSNFGVVTRMLNQGIGGSLGSIYSTGGSRSMELALRLQF